MKKFIVFALCSLMLFGCTSAKDSSLDEKFLSLEQSVDTATLASVVAPAVVGISSTDSDGTAVGSGVCVASGGYVLTNSHVITNPNNITVHLVNGNEVNAKLIFNDSVQDVAVVKANATLPYLKLADTDEVKVGQDVLAVGTPLSLTLKHTFTKGIVSALNRTIKVSTLSGEAYMQNLIQHDASINPGNSGGPLINNKAEVVGINTLKISGGEGIGFAIPAKSIKSLLGSLIKDEDYAVPYLGMYGYDAQIANYYNATDKSNGVYIIDIASNSPLKEAGLKSGDVIIALGENQIDNMLDLRDALYRYKAGQQLQVEFYQNGVHKMSRLELSKNYNL